MRHSRAITAAITAAVTASLCAVSPTSAQEAEDKDKKEPPVIAIPLPADTEIDAETLEALKRGFKEEKERFLKGLIELHAQRVDYTRDSPRRILEKQRAARAAFQKRAAPKRLEDFDRAAVMLNVVQIRNATAPRLSGRVLKVGENEKYASLEAALAELRSGDKVLLGAGLHTWPSARRRVALPSDVAIVGLSRDSILVFQTRPIVGGQRLRLSGLTIEYPGRPFYQARGNSSLELLECALNNTAARGYALYGSDAIVYVEGCVFDAASEASQRRSSAAVFRLYRDSLLYVRRSRFFNYRRSIGVGQTGSVFEKVVIEGENPAAAGRLIASRAVFTRSNISLDGAAIPCPGETGFERATDDAGLVASAAGQDGGALDKESERLIKVLGLRRNLGFWIGLLRHRDETVRALAAERVQALSGEEVRLVADSASAQGRRIKALIARLDSAVFSEREGASAELKELGEGAREALEEARRSGSLEQQARADAILSELDAAAMPQHLVEWARLLRWYEKNGEDLKWDAEGERYRITKD